MTTEVTSLQLRIDNTQALSASDAFTVACLKAEQAVVLTDRTIRAMERGFGQLAAGQAKATQVAAQNAIMVERLRTETGNYTQALVNEIGKVTQAVQAQTQYTAAIAQSVAETQALAQAQRAAGAAADHTSARQASLGSTMRTVLGVVTALAGGFSLTLGARAAVANTAELETALVGVTKTTNLSGAALDQYKQQIAEMASRTPVATASLYEISQAAGQLGVRGVENLTKFTETVAKLASATNIQGGDGAKKLARLIGINGEDIGASIEPVGAAITRLGNESRASESEILGNAVMVAQATAQYRIGSINALALGAAMKSLGINAEIGGTAVGRTMDAIDKAIRKPGPEMEILKKLTGQTAEEIAGLFKTDPTAQFARFIGGLNAAGQAGEDVKGVLEALGLQDIRIARVLPTLGGSYGELAAAIQKAREEGERQQALNAESARAFETLASKSQMAKNVIGLMSDGAVRPATTLMKGLLDVIRGVSTESPKMQVAITGVTAAITAFAAVQVVGTLLSITRAVQGVTGALAAMRIATLSNPWGWLIGGAAAIVATIVSISSATNDQTEAQLRLNKATEAWAPIAQALADADAKRKSADLLKDPSLVAASVDGRIAAAKRTLDELNKDSSPFLGADRSVVKAFNVVDLFTTPQSQQVLEERAKQRAFDTERNYQYPSQSFEQMRQNRTSTDFYTEDVKAALAAEIQALEALKQKMQEAGAVRQSTGADIEAQRAKLTELLNTMRDEEAASAMGEAALRAMTLRRDLEKDMTDAQKAALGGLVTQIVDQSIKMEEAKRATDDAARAHERYADSIEKLVEGGAKAEKTLQDMIDKVQLDIDTVQMAAEERALYVAQIQAQKLAEESMSSKGAELAAQFIERIKALTAMRIELADTTAATEEAARAGEALKSAQLSARESLHRMNLNLEDEIDLAGLDADEQERRAAAYNAVRAAVAAGYPSESADKAGRIVMGQVAILQELRNARNFADALGSDVAGVFSRLAESTLTWDSAMKALNDTARQTLQTFLQYAAIQPLARGLANAFMPFTSAIVGPGAPAGPGGSGVESSTMPYGGRGGAFALGGTVVNGEIVRYAAGGVAEGIYNSATFFPLRNGKVGVMGEAGEEMAAEPVKLPSGRLGVRAFGGTSSNVHNGAVFNGDIVFQVQGDVSNPDAMRRSARQAAGHLRRMMNG